MRVLHRRDHDRRPRPRRWVLVALAGFVVITALFGQASAAGAGEPPKDEDEDSGYPGFWDNLRGRACGSDKDGLMAVIGIAQEIVEKTPLCKSSERSGDYVYCNGTSLFSMLDPNVGFGGDLTNKQGGIDKSSAVLNALTPGEMKLVIDQLNGKWYRLDRDNFKGSLEWYPPQAEQEAIERGNCTLLERTPAKQCKEMSPDEKKSHNEDGILPDDCAGTYPSANYNIVYDEGNFLSVNRKIWGGLTGLAFNIGKGSVQIATWSIGKAFSVQLSDYTRFSKGISDRYNNEIVGEWSLADFAWLVLIGFVAFTALRGKLAVAGGEFVVAIVMMGMAQVMLANQSAYMDSVSDVMNLASGSFFEISRETNGDDVLGPETTSQTTQWDSALTPLKRNIHQQFVERPYEYLNWGRPVSSVKDQECRTRLERVVSLGATDDEGWSRRYLNELGGECATIAAHSASPSTDRLLGSLMTMMVSIIVSWTLTLIAITVLVAKFTLAILFALLPFAVAGAALPGSLRSGSILLVTNGIQCVVVVIVGSCILSMAVMAVDYVLDVTDGDSQACIKNPDADGCGDAAGSLAERWAPVLVGGIAFMVIWKRFTASTQQMSENMRSGIVRLSPAAAGWSGQGGGLDLLSADRGMQRAAVGAAYAGAITTGAVAGNISQRHRERRQAKRALKNLEIMEQRREVPQLETVTDARTGQVLEEKIIRKSRQGKQPYSGRSRGPSASSEARAREHAASRGIHTDRGGRPVRTRPPHPTRPRGAHRAQGRTSRLAGGVRNRAGSARRATVNRVSRIPVPRMPRLPRILPGRGGRHRRPGRGRFGR